MSNSELTLAIIGCGDFLRWQLPSLHASRRVRVAALYDLDAARAARFAGPLSATVAPSLDAIYEDPRIDAVALFVPPWVRRAAVEQAAAAGKHILTTKPLAPDAADGSFIEAAVQGAGVRAAVLYGRTEDAAVATLAHLFRERTFGRLVLYKQDWIHHYPAWNDWALDPSKNGGPFMDAMIHNLNTARHLMDRPATHATFFSDRLAHPDLPCADTESLKIDFADGGTAHLFITWAADLAVYSLDGNDREHHDHHFLVTDHGWHLSRARHDGREVIRASRLGETRFLPLRQTGFNAYDAFADVVLKGAELPPELVSLRMAAEDIRIIRRAEAQVGRRVALELTD